eukprot:Lithocolla_globosa_v1_NODE_681_length_3450_cov_13.498969.p2 type:complete len:197 gc:universal NODE_681_length_3450_cov_13.498969:1892-1302(-)
MPHMLLHHLLCDYPHCGEQVSFRDLLLSGLLLFFLAQKAFPNVLGDHLIVNGAEDFVEHALADVHQHVCIEKLRFVITVAWSVLGLFAIFFYFLTEVFIECLSWQTFCDAIVIEFEPGPTVLGCDEGAVVPTVQIAVVNKHSSQNILVLFLLFWVDEKFGQVNLHRKFVVVVDFDHGVAVHIIFESFQLQMQNGRE